MRLPCKGCICYPICKARYKRLIGDDLDRWVPILKPFVTRAMCEKCDILVKYFLLEYNSRLIPHKLIIFISNMRYTCFNRYMQRRIS